MYRSANEMLAERKRSPFDTSGRTVMDLIKVALATRRLHSESQETAQDPDVAQSSPAQLSTVPGGSISPNSDASTSRSSAGDPIVRPCASPVRERTVKARLSSVRRSPLSPARATQSRFLKCDCGWALVYQLPSSRSIAGISSTLNSQTSCHA